VKKLTIEEQYRFFKDSFSYCGCFLLELNDKDILYYLFEEFDTFATSFLHSAMLDPLRESGYINDEIVSMCQLLRDRYIKLGNSGKIWGAEEIKASSDWLDLFRLADVIHMRLADNIH